MALVWQPISLIALVLAVYIGLKFPDVDQRVGFLLHRSIITHGPLLPLVAFAFALGDNPVQRRLGVGIGIGFAVHIAFDLFPKAWQGYALISLPWYGWTPAKKSFLGSGSRPPCSLTSGIAIRLCRNGMDVTVLLLAAAAAFAIVAPGENALWRPLAVVALRESAAYTVHDRAGQRLSESQEKGVLTSKQEPVHPWKNSGDKLRMSGFQAHDEGASPSRCLVYVGR